MTPASDPPLDRRPIAARRLRPFQQLAAALARKGVSANAISTLGMVAGVLGGIALFLTSRFPGSSRALWGSAAALIQLRLLANMLDGMVAIERGTASRVGELYNEVPDRVSDSAILIGLGYATGGNILLGYGAALAAIFTAYVRAVGKAGGAPSEFCGPMAKQHRMFLATIVALFLAAAPEAWGRVEFTGVSMGVAEVALILIAAGSVVTAVRRLLRIAGALKGAP